MKGKGNNTRLELEEGDKDVFMTKDGSVWERTKRRKRKETPREAQMRNPKNRITGETTRCFKCNSEVHFANKCTVKRNKEDDKKAKEWSMTQTIWRHTARF